LNVLVLGSNSSGKTSLINSMNMAYHQEWKDRARYCPGRAHVLQECVVFRNRSRGSNVVFWDTRGFENIHEDSHAVLILRYILEGRIDPKCLSCVLLMTKKMMKERYTEKNPRRRIDLVLFVSDLTQEPNRHLMDLVEQAISDSKRYSSIRNVPILSVCTKADSVREIPCCEKLNEYNLELLRYQRRHPNALDDLDLDQVVGRRPVIVIDNYWSEMDPVSDEPEFTLFRKFDPQLDNPQPDDNTSLDTEPDFTSTGVHPGQVTPCPARDSRLLSIWNEIIQSTAACGGGHDMRKRNYSPARRTLLGCLPFSISNNVFRLRSSSI
jgi:GTPase SAR1 family protein